MGVPFASLLAGAFLLSPEAPQQIVPSSPAETVQRIAAEEARQGVAVDRDYAYAVANWTIAKYDRKTGARVQRWEGDPKRFPHLNSCAIIAAELVCAASNFPAVPHASSVEFFDPATLTHKRSVSLGQGTGSLTWIAWRDGHWWAMFANYDGKGGEAGRDHRHTQLVKMDSAWRRTEAWALPASILSRVAPMSISGGDFRADGTLWLSGHDLPEFYVTRLPKGGATLDHLATVPAEAEGQAIVWDPAEPNMMWGIVRRTKTMVKMRVPNVKF